MRKLSVPLLTLVLAVALLVATNNVLAGGDDTTRLTTSLRGAEEVNAAGVPNQGDPDGRGWAELYLKPGEGKVCYKLSVRYIAPATAAHIHQAPWRKNGPVVVTLAPPTDGYASGCVRASSDLIRNIIRYPRNYYVNVHNERYPAGALRGQLGD
jgi:hypothetical protein